MKGFKIVYELSFNCYSFVFFSLSKAFDSILPSLTVAKLGAFGFNDKSLQLMRSYLKDRLNRGESWQSYQ